MQKWIPELQKYVPYVVPDSWHTPIYTTDMKEIVNCASCGEPTEYGHCYCSKSIHNMFGFGYPVCENCYDEEVQAMLCFKEKIEGKTE